MDNESLQLKVAKAAHDNKYKKPNPGPVYSWPMGIWFSIFFIVPIIIILAFSFGRKTTTGSVQFYENPVYIGSEDYREQHKTPGNMTGDTKLKKDITSVQHFTKDSSDKYRLESEEAVTASKGANVLKFEKNYEDGTFVEKAVEKDGALQLYYNKFHWTLTTDAYVNIFNYEMIKNAKTGTLEKKYTYLPLLWRTLWTTVIATLLSLAIALPCGYAMARSKYQTVFLVLIIIPFLTNSLIRIFAWKTLLGAEGPVNQLLSMVFPSYTPDNLYGNNLAIIIVNMYMYLPYAILPIFTAVDRFDFTLLEAARDLGASKAVSIRKVLLPGIKSGIISSVIFTFIPIFGNYTVPALVGSIDTRMIGQTIYEAATKSRNFPLASSFSVILTVVSMIAIIYMLMSENSEKKLNQVKSE